MKSESAMLDSIAVLIGSGTPDRVIAAFGIEPLSLLCMQPIAVCGEILQQNLRQTS